MWIFTGMRIVLKEKSWNLYTPLLPPLIKYQTRTDQTESALFWKFEKKLKFAKKRKDSHPCVKCFVYIQVGQTPLHLAASNGSDAILQLILSTNNCDLDHQTKVSIKCFVFCFVLFLLLFVCFYQMVPHFTKGMHGFCCLKSYSCIMYLSIWANARQNLK